MHTTTDRPADAAARVAPASLRLTVGLVALGLFGGITGSWLLVLLSAALLVATGLARWLPGELALCAAVSALIAVAAVAGEAAAALHVHLPARGVLLLPAALTAHLLLRRGSRPTARADSSRLRALAAVPAAGAALVGLAQLLSTRLVAAWALGGTDLAEHTVMLGQVQRVGGLDYGHDGYPRGLQMLIALCTTTGSSSFAALSRDLRVWGAVTWLLFGLMLLASATATRQLAVAAGLPDRTAQLLGLGTAAVLLSCRSLQGAFVLMGAAPSLLAVVVIWLLVLPNPRSPRLNRPLLAAAAFVVLAHLWQALLVVPATIAAVEVLALARARCLHRERLLRLTVAWLLALATAAPAVIALLRSGGLSLAATTGNIPPVPLAGGVVTIGALVLTAVGPHRRPARLLLTAAAALLVVVGQFLRSNHNGFDLTEYYPMKVCWFVVLVSAPLVGATAGRVWAAGTTAVRPHLRTRSGHRLVTVTAAVLPAALVIALALPGLVSAQSLPRQALGVGSLDDRGGRRLTLARDLAERYAPARTLPVALGLTYNVDQYGAYVTAKLLRFQTGQPATSGWVGTICTEARRVDDGHGVVVVTDLDVRLVESLTRRQGCSGLRVVRLPGTDPRLVRAYEGSVRKLLARGLL